MIEFKKVCENFNLILAHTKAPNRDIFLNSSLEIVQNPAQEASFEEVLSALQERKWEVSTETTEEIQENIKKIWQQTILIYEKSSNSYEKKMLEFYQDSICKGVFFDSCKCDEYATAIRQQCESLSMRKVLHHLANAFIHPIKEGIHPILEKFDRQIEKTYQQASALHNTDELRLLKEWKRNFRGQFFSVFFEECDGIVKQTFPELLRICELTDAISAKKKKSKRKRHSCLTMPKEMRNTITPRDLREKLLKIVERAPLIEIDILNKLRFIILKNSKFIFGINFRGYYKVIKGINQFIDDLEKPRQNFFKLEQSAATLSSMGSDHLPLASAEGAQKLEGNIKLMQSLIVSEFCEKRNLSKKHFFNHPLLIEISLIKVKGSYFFDREMERLQVQNLINQFPQSSMDLEKANILYRSLLQELDKLQSKKQSGNQHEFYKISEEVRNFFLDIGKDITQIPTLDEFMTLQAPLLEPIFSENEIGIITEFFKNLEEKESEHYEKMIASMYETALEWQPLEKEELLSKIHKPIRKSKDQLTRIQKKSVEEPLPSPFLSQNWSENIPIKVQNKVDLLYPLHVTRWFTDPENSLRDPKYKSIIKQFGRDRCLCFHSFPISIDELVGTEYSLQNEVQNERTGQKDTLYGIPGECEIKGQKYRGFFQYIIDTKSRTCYHRCFNPRAKNFIKDLIQEKVWYPNDFPTLDQSKEYIGKKMDTFTSEEMTLQYDSILRKISVKTERMKVILFNNFDSDLVNEFCEFMNKDGEDF